MEFKVIPNVISLKMKEFVHNIEESERGERHKMLFPDLSSSQGGHERKLDTIAHVQCVHEKCDRVSSEIGQGVW
jgi:hypothetical protein